MKWIDEITIEDIDEQYRHIAERIGVEQFIELIKGLGGTSWYLPKLDKVLYRAIKRKILREYNNYNKKELALKYGISEKTVERITKEKNIQQLRLF
ncbi:MAG: Mor transcription activator family protein [Clostridiales bacterium]|nr:Mor transcription activator family protein [Clostridiales bacterium]